MEALRKLLESAEVDDLDKIEKEAVIELFMHQDGFMRYQHYLL